MWWINTRVTGGIHLNLKFACGRTINSATITTSFTDLLVSSKLFGEQTPHLPRYPIVFGLRWMTNWTTDYFGQLDDTRLSLVNLCVKLFLSERAHTRTQHTRQSMPSSSSRQMYSRCPNTHPHTHTANNNDSGCDSIGIGSRVKAERVKNEQEWKTSAECHLFGSLRQQTPTKTSKSRTKMRCVRNNGRGRERERKGKRRRKARRETIFSRSHLCDKCEWAALSDSVKREY